MSLVEVVRKREPLPILLAALKWSTTGSASCALFDYVQVRSPRGSLACENTILITPASPQAQHIEVDEDEIARLVSLLAELAARTDDQLEPILV